MDPQTNQNQEPINQVPQPMQPANMGQPGGLPIQPDAYGQQNQVSVSPTPGVPIQNAAPGMQVGAQPTVVPQSMPTTNGGAVVGGGFSGDPMATTAPMMNAPADAFNAAAQMPAPRKRSWLKRIIFAFLILIGLGVIGVLAIIYVPKLQKSIHKSLYTSGQTGALKQLTSYSGGITAAQVAKLNPADAFYAVFAHAAQQSIVTTTSSYYFSDSPTDYGQSPNIRQVGFNYGTKQYSLEMNSPDVAGDTSGPDETRCVNGQQYDYLSSFSDMGWQKSGDSNDCSLQALPLEGLNDGLNAGGLTAAQAQTFVLSLRNNSGLMKVNNVKLVNQSGKSLLRFDATLTPLHSSLGWFGMQYFMWAFKDTGVDPGTLPYTYLGAGGDGMRLAYYVDPTTQLPVYSQIQTTAVLGDNGKPESTQTYDYYHVEYQFGGTIPSPTLQGFTPLKLNWPTNEKLQ